MGLKDKDYFMKLKRQKISLLLLIIIIMTFITSCSLTEHTESDKNMNLLKLTTDKAMYEPGSDIELKISLKEDEPIIENGTYKLEVWHLNNRIFEKEGKLDYSKEVPYIYETWEASTEDFKGYLISVDLYDSKKRLLDTDTVGVDVSSEWVKFPRYGYLTSFSKDTDVENIINQLKDFHINGIQYYDWHFLHHQPIPEDGSMEWQDWSGRDIDGNIIKSLIKEAHDKNIVSMAYNMIYAATNNYKDYGIDDKWGLWHAEEHNQINQHKGDRFTFNMGSSPSGQSDLIFFDITNPHWQDYIINKNKAAIEEMGFDGWHGDTVGEWGKMWRYDEIGNPDLGIYVKDGYTEFLNEAKNKLGEKYLSFNPVGAQGIENVNKSNVDVLYSEIWPWEKDSEGNQYDDYNSLKIEIDNSRKESEGKSLTIPAYMEYDYANEISNVPFDMSAVLLTDAVVYASGGSRLELGDGNNMLSNEYFPKKNLYMTPEHLDKQHAYQDFIVAYENLLRDGQEDNNNLIEIEDYPVSKDGSPNTIWSFSKSDSDYETIQFINLIDVNDNDWRANNGEKDNPRRIANIKVKYYTDDTPGSVWATSPDEAYLSKSVKLNYETGEDENGKYITFTMPSLEFWSMVYLAPNDTEFENTSNIGEIQLFEYPELKNGDFSEGLKYWQKYNDDAVVEDNILKIQGNRIGQGLYQTLVGLENGTYDIEIKANQYGTKSPKSRIEITGTGNINKFIEFPYSEEKVTLNETFEVKNNRARIGIYHESIINANLEVEEIKIKKSNN